MFAVVAVSSTYLLMQAEQTIDQLQKHRMAESLCTQPLNDWLQGKQLLLACTKSGTENITHKTRKGNNEI